MRPFKYTNAKDLTSAATSVTKNPHAKLLAGGTNILDLMKEDVERPEELVDISRLKLNTVQLLPSGGLSLGALATNSATANHLQVREKYPLLSQAILAGASAQIRNMATNGGNINQRTRCPYFYDVAMPCNKREPGSGCGAKEGFNRMHAILGWSDSCVAVNPSDMNVALVALDASVKIRTANGTPKIIPFIDYHVLPGDNPQADSILKHGEIITSIELPKNNFAAHSYYLKVRDRASYAFALVSVAAALEMSGDEIKEARIALGGVAHKPWRATEAKEFMKGKAATVQTFREAADIAFEKARPLEHNIFKIELGKRAVVRALTQAFNGNA